MSLELVVNQDSKAVEDYRIGQQVVRHQCPACLSKVMTQIADIDSMDPRCSHCKKRGKR